MFIDFHFYGMELSLISSIIYSERDADATKFSCGRFNCDKNMRGRGRKTSLRTNEKKKREGEREA